MKRRWFYLLALLFVLGLGALDVAFLLRPRELQRMIDAELDQNLKVAFEYRRVTLGLRTLAFEDFTLYRDAERRMPLLFCRRAELDLDLGALMAGDVEIERIRIEDPDLHLVWDERGQLSLPSVIEPSDSKVRAPTIPALEIRGLRLRLVDAPLFEDGDPVVLGPIEVDLERGLSSSWPYGFRGAFRDPVFGDVAFRGDFGGARFRGAFRHRHATVNPRMVRLLRRDWREALEPVTVEGAVDVDLEVRADDVLDTVEFLAVAETESLVLRHEAFPEPIRVDGGARWENGRLRSDLLLLSFGDARLLVDEAWADFTGDGPPRVRAHGRAEDLWIDQDFADSLARLPEPFDEIKAAIEAFGIEGAVDLDIALAHREPFDRIQVDATVAFKEMDFAYRGYPDDVTGLRHGYPYRVHKLVGSARIGNDGLTVADVRSLAAEQDVAIEATVAYGREPFAFRVAVSGRDLALDEHVREALPPSSLRVFESFRPEGFADLDIVVASRTHVPSDPVDVDLRIGLHLTSARPDVFPLELTNMEGDVFIRRGEPVRIVGVEADRGAARLGIDGTLSVDDDGNTPDWALAVRAQDLQLGDDVFAAMAAGFPDVAAELRRLDLKGPIDLRCDLDAEPGGDRFEIDMKGLGLRVPSMPNARLTDLEGRLTVRGTRLDSSDASARILGSLVKGTGWVDFGEPRRWRLAVSAPDLALDDEILDLIGQSVPDVAKLREDWVLGGAVTAELRLASDGAASTVDAVVIADGVTADARRSTFALLDVHGELRSNGDAIELERFTAVLPYEPDWPQVPAHRAELTLEKGAWSPTKGLSVSGLSLRNLVFTERFFAMLPEGIAATLRDGNLRGRTDIDLEVLRWREGRGDVRGTLRPEEVRSDALEDATFHRGTVEVDHLAFDGDGVIEGRGRLARGHLHYGPFELEQIQAQWELDDARIVLREIEGGVLRGRLSADGSHVVFDRRERAFDVAATLVEADLEAFAETLGGRPGAVSGLANVKAGLSGRLGDPATYRGEGAVRMRGRKLYELPFFAPVLEILNLDFLSSPERSVQSGEMEVRIRDEKILVDRARFLSPGIDLDGDGVIGFDGICRFAFEPRAIKVIDALPVVGEIYALLSGVVVSKVLVTGPIERPTASVANWLTEVLPGEPDSGRRPVIRPPRLEDER